MDNSPVAKIAKFTTLVGIIIFIWALNTVYSKRFTININLKDLQFAITTEKSDTEPTIGQISIVKKAIVLSAFLITTSGLIIISAFFKRRNKIGEMIIDQIIVTKISKKVDIHEPEDNTNEHE